MLDLATAAALKNLTDLLGSLAKSRDARRRDLFEKILTPFNDSFVEVHEAYEKLFFDTWVSYRKLPDPKPTDEIWMAFSQAREETRFERMRDDVRNAAQEVLQASKDPDFRRFMCSFFYYFLDDTGQTRSPSFYDEHAAAIIVKGGISEMDTPSSRMMNDLKAVKSHEQGEQIIANGIAILTKRFSDCQKFFWRLRRTTYTD
jgi:hypothetical protein